MPRLESNELSRIIIDDPIDLSSLFCHFTSAILYRASVKSLLRAEFRPGDWKELSSSVKKRRYVRLSLYLGWRKDTALLNFPGAPRAQTERDENVPQQQQPCRYDVTLKDAIEREARQGKLINRARGGERERGCLSERIVFKRCNLVLILAGGKTAREF